MLKTNLITGFLGSGKTTTIQHLLRTKSADERWAVLINEFGEIGIDGTLLKQSGAYLKEIPGGCLCCVNSLSLQVGLNTLLRQANADRLLIEPTGLGHPKQILALLTAEQYRLHLDLRATLCILDARQLSDSIYYRNNNFRDQLLAADILIANKTDHYHERDYQALEHWQQQAPYLPNIITTHYGNIDWRLLDSPHLNQVELSHAHHSVSPHSGSLLTQLRLATGQSWRRALHEGQGYYSCGWIFDPDTCFNTTLILDWVRLNPAQRVKGAMRIPEGTLLFNRQEHDLHIETQAIAPLDSRVEIIHSTSLDWNILQNALHAARIY